MKCFKIVTLFLFAVIVSQPGLAKMDLVTLPERDTTQLTIYNAADLTLVRDGRALTMKKGRNQLQFSWSKTLIDPTSLELLPKANGDQIDILDLTYPPRVKNLGVWNIDSDIEGKVPVEITYLTSGISWRAFYMGTLAQDEKTMRLKGYVRVTNNSGEDYEKAQTRLIVGKVHLLDQVAQLAGRQYPYGRPPGSAPLDEPQEAVAMVKGAKILMSDMAAMTSKAASLPAQKEITKEGLSEYFLFTIEGTETIPTGWSKRLPSFDVRDVPVVNLYKFEQERYGNQAVRFLSFKNDKSHQLGVTPIPGGMLKVYRSVDDANHLSYEGQSSFKYIPVNQKVALNLGPAPNVIVDPKLMDYHSDHYTFDEKGQITGWDEIRTFRVDVKNTRAVAIELEIKRNIDAPYWDLKNSGEYGQFEKEDKDTVKYTLALPPQGHKSFDYVLTTYHGFRQSNH